MCFAVGDNSNRKLKGKGKDGRGAFDSGVSASLDLHAILITGFASKDLLQESDRGDVLQFLEKSIDLDELRRTMQTACQAEKIPGDNATRGVRVAPSPLG
jgi:DNA-binding NtrC family response regulator